MPESDQKERPANGRTNGVARYGQRKVAVVLTIVLVFIVGGIVLLAFMPPRAEIVAEKGPVVMAVRVQATVLTNLPEIVTMTGRIEAEQEVRLAVETSGRVIWLGAEKGDSVVAEQDLLRLDSRSQTAAVTRAGVNLRQAEDDLKRWLALKEAGSVSSLEYESVLNRRDLARLALDEARTDYDRSHVHTPIDGRLEERTVEVGEMVNPGVPVFRVVKTDRVKVVVDVPERDVNALRVGEAVRFEADALRGMTFTGKVAFVAAVADLRSNTFRIELLVDNPGGLLKPGMIARVAVLRGIIGNAVIVPLSALVPIKGQYIAYVVEAGRTVRRVVKLETVVDVLAVVQEGLKPGEQVVVEGQRLVTDGMAVTVTP